LARPTTPAAKLGIFGLTKATALDMSRYNVTANCISPFAWTRDDRTIPTETTAQKARVEKIKKLSPPTSRRSPSSWRATPPGT
jgi:NAD(P)-dependent dehydrogenase (short-subunit alcohol dehydrogenase family)